MFYGSSDNLIRRTRRGAVWRLLVLGLYVFFSGPAPPSLAEAIPSPDVLLKRGIENKTNPTDIADTFIGIPFREDGTIDEQGRFTQFEHPERRFDTPGFNCSGFVLSVSRYLVKRNITIESAKLDRLDDSGSQSPLGLNWDFGWDLIFNVAGNLPSRVLSPGVTTNLYSANGETLRGFDLTDDTAWKTVLAEMIPGRLYLASLSKPDGRLGSRLRHYHVALLLADGGGGKWFYHTTLRSGTHKMNLAATQGMNRLRAQFTGAVSKKILIIEVNPTGSGVFQPGRPPRQDKKGGD